MTEKTHIFNKGIGWHRVFIVMILCFFGCNILLSKTTRKSHGRRAPKDNRVYLIHADVLSYDQYTKPDAQILKGNVAFRHAGARLLCDSALFYESTNSFEAFGHVKMYQGDTLSLFSDYAYYDGDADMAEARRNVVLKHRKTTLYTDSLNYDRLYNIGYFFEGGKMIDKKNTLTSDWGEYNTETKEAAFNYGVVLRNKKFRLTTDTLYYDTHSSMARIVGPSNIYSGKSTIYSERGFYDTDRGRARLLDRSILKNGTKELIGDSVVYDDKNGISKAYFDVVYTDTANKNRLTCNYCLYNEKTGFALATDSALVMDYSQPDTLFLHADTLKLFTFNINTDSVYRKVLAYNKVRIFRTDLQAVCDSLVFDSRDSCATMYKDPIIWNMNQQLLGEEIRAYVKDSTIDWVHVVGQAFSAEKMADGKHYNQVSSDEMKTFFEKKEVREVDAIKSVKIVYYPIDEADSVLIGLNYMETSLFKMFMENRKMQKMWTPQCTGTLYPMSQIPPEKPFLQGFVWFDYVRPTDKMDVFNWRPKAKGTELKPQKRRELPLQHLQKNKSD